jgi:hypothetical protein
MQNRSANHLAVPCCIDKNIPFWRPFASFFRIQVIEMAWLIMVGLSFSSSEKILTAFHDRILNQSQAVTV